MVKEKSKVEIGFATDMVDCVDRQMTGTRSKYEGEPRVALPPNVKAIHLVMLNGPKQFQVGRPKD